MSTQKTPEIRIYFSWLLYEVSKKLQKVYDQELASEADCETWAKAYKNEWSKYEGKILPALCEVLGVDFYQSVIDVPCAPFFIPQSEPLIIHFRAEPDEFVDVLTHELIHVLLTDNNVYSTKDAIGDTKLFDVWQRLFGKKHDFHVLAHIPVHALHKYVMLDVLKAPERLDRERGNTRKNNSEAYVKAWGYVDQRGYMEIIDALKQSYKKDF